MRAAGTLDCLALPVAAFAAFVNASGTYPELSAGILLLGIALLIVLAVTATVDERPGHR